MFVANKNHVSNNKINLAIFLTHMIVSGSLILFFIKKNRK
jgi:hypothetical protein